MSRHRGGRKESGLVTDALRFGIPLVCSDHHHDLTRQLTGRPWAALFPSGDATQLADILDRLADQRLPAPDPDASAALDVPTPQDQVVFLVNHQQGEPR
ncbi:hypothetical protein [Streptacidiphilus sp. P02-A3a]|uniref:hypothetical protein n=1 Tax=Streptacidiphilus sp. P02-A3a TaxID=2704468 RepID=UPI0015FE2147|nr:hypothetical protein [Streptacidiphilus sp. P02-A3a]QMU72785.1 hypothetical protein GXP74_35575 [Streptacidiphilus sp. P02-A3a]